MTFQRPAASIYATPLSTNRTLSLIASSMRVITLVVSMLFLHANPVAAFTQSQTQHAAPVVDHNRPDPFAAHFPLLEKDDPDYAVAHEVMVRISPAAEEKKIRFIFYPPRRIMDVALERLLPDVRFITIGWEPEILDPDVLKSVHVPGGMRCTLAIADGRGVFELWNFGSHTRFGELLATHDVMIRDEDDARLVWEAFCVVTLRPRWSQRPHKQAGLGIWQLGIQEIDGIRYFYEVILDDADVITGATYRSERVPD